ncbi:MAG: hypothetical protein KGL20_00410 [Rhodospirillales bacterium]|nr:hypothetical protein [Rhodospirillales bacterium]
MNTKQVEHGGKVYAVKKLSAVDRMKLADLGMNFDDDEVKALAYLAASVSDVDGVPLKPIRTKADVYDRVDKLEPALSEIAEAFGELNGESATAKDVEAAKN